MNTNNSTAKLNRNKYLAAAGILLLCAIYLPMSLSGNVAVDRIASLVSLMCFVLLFMGAKKISHVFPAIAIYFVLFLSTMTHTIGSVVLVVFTAVSFGANELILSRDKIWRLVGLFAILPIAFGATYLLTQDLPLSSLAVVPFVLLSLLAISVKNKMNRKDGIVLLSGGVIGMCVIALAIYMLISKLSFVDIQAAYAGTRDSFINYVTGLTVDFNGETVSMFTDVALARELMISMSNALPSVLVIATIVFFFFLYNYQCSMLEKAGAVEYITKDIMEIKISAAAAAVYLIAFVLSITTDSYGGEPFGSVVCKNIYMILTPALAYSGVKSVKYFIKKKRIRIGFLLILLLGLLAMTGYLFNILSLLGIICIFAKNAKEWAEKKD